MTLFTSTDNLKSRVDAELNAIVSTRDMQPFYRMMSYHMGWADQFGNTDTSMSRERNHGVLSLLSCRAAGGDIEAALPVAAAVELVHNFCQIHDDVQGGNPQRDSQDAVWWVWGPAQAINAGDGMHALARLALLQLLDKGVSPETTFQAVRILDDGSLQTCEGRFMDLEAQERIDMSVDVYINMASKKTGALASCAMELGTLVATDDKDAIAALATCGAKLGIAMQMRWDMQELWPNGDASGMEVMNKKKLLPVVYALEKAAISDKRKMGDIFFKRVLERDDVIRLREIIEQLGAREDSENLIRQYRTEALSALSTPGISNEGGAQIEEFIDSLLG